MICVLVAIGAFTVTGWAHELWRTRKDKQFCSDRCRTRKWLLEQKAK